jgi:hypothetical protein
MGKNARDFVNIEECDVACREGELISMVTFTSIVQVEEEGSFAVLFVGVECGVALTIIVSLRTSIS